jgi:pyruvate/2-oxoglutarate dehydrogenase complex dihydrolipoamide dehydrogenase (E3) component
MEKIKNIEVVKKKVTPEEIKNEKYDAVVVAIGGKTLKPDITGIESNKVLDWDEAMNGAEMGKNVIVTGGGLIGTELAMYLAENGKQVTIVEMLDNVAIGVEKAAITVVMEKIAELKIETQTGQRLEAITEKGAITVDHLGNKKEFEADQVILALGLSPQRDLAAALKDEDMEVFEVGDALKPRKIFDAIHEGHVAVRYL